MRDLRKNCKEIPSGFWSKKLRRKFNHPYQIAVRPQLSELDTHQGGKSEKSEIRTS